METHYKATWSRSLTVISVLVSLLCLVMVVVGIVAFHGWEEVGVTAVAGALLLLAPLFVIRGYTVTQDEIFVQRLFWSTRLPRTGLQSAEFIPGAVRGSIRLFGNGGMFSFTGIYHNSMLGVYRALVTNLDQTVVLRYSSKKVVVVSPEPAQAFVQEIVPIAANTLS